MSEPTDPNAKKWAKLFATIFAPKPLYVAIDIRGKLTAQSVSRTAKGCISRACKHHGASCWDELDCKYGMSIARVGGKHDPIEMTATIAEGATVEYVKGHKSEKEVSQ